MSKMEPITLADALVSSRGQDMRGSGPPSWREGDTNKMPMSDVEARRLRGLLIKALPAFFDLYPQADDFVRRLEACRLARPCRSGGCPVCWRATRRLVVHASWRLFRESDQYTYVTWLCALDMASPGRLEQAQPLRSVEQRLLSIAQRTNTRIFGGLDLSANEHRDHLFPPHFMPHAHFLAPVLAYDRHKEAWDPADLRHSLVRVPVLAKPYDGRRRAIAYSLKPIIERRVSLAPHVTVDGTHRRADTRGGKPLRRSQRVELALMLDRAGLEARVIAYGYDFVTDGDDVWVVPVDSHRADELLVARQQRRAEREAARVLRDITARRAPPPFHL